MKIRADKKEIDEVIGLSPHMSALDKELCLNMEGTANIFIIIVCWKNETPLNKRMLDECLLME